MWLNEMCRTSKSCTLRMGNKEKTLVGFTFQNMRLLALADTTLLLNYCIFSSAAV